MPEGKITGDLKPTHLVHCKVARGHEKGDLKIKRSHNDVN